MLLTEMSSYNNAVKQYGKKAADFWAQFDFSPTKRYVKKMCDLFYIDKITQNEITKIFRIYQEHEKLFDAIGINYNQLSWDKLNELVLRQIGEYDSHFQLPNQFFESDDGLITIGYFNTFEEAMGFEPKNGWCVCVNQGRFEEHHDINHEMLYIIRNCKLPKSSNCRFVVAQVNIDGGRVYWSQNDNCLKQTSDGKHISLSEYETSLGDAVNQLQPMKIEDKNNQETNENKIMNKKQVIRLNENQLKQIVTESVKRVLKETAGHLYYKDDEGNPHTNSKELYRGVKGAIFVYHGDWADPEILYKNHSINYWDAEQSLWYNYKEFCEENDIKPTDDGFEKYVNEYEDVASTLDDLVWALDGNP